MFLNLVQVNYYSIALYGNGAIKLVPRVQNTIFLLIFLILPEQYGII